MPALDPAWLASLDAASDYRAIFSDQLGSITRETGEEAWARCPVHEDCDDPGKFSFNTRTGVWICHKHDEGGNILGLLKKLKPKSWRDEWVRICPRTAEVFGALPPPEKRNGSGHNRPPAFSDLCRDKARETTDAMLEPLAQAWGVTVYWLRAHGWFVMFGGVEGSKHPKYCVPVFDGDQIVGVKVRFLSPFPVVKGKDGEEHPVKSKNLYGSKPGFIGGQELWRTPHLPVLLIEGEKDQAVASFDYGDKYAVISGSLGCKVMREEMAVHLRGRDVTLLYDEDTAGNEGGKIACLKIKKVAKSIKWAHIGLPGKDTFNLLREDNMKGHFEASIAQAVDFDPKVDADIRAIIMSAIPDDAAPNVVELCKHIFQVLKDAGALWLHTKSREAYCIYDGRSFSVSKTDPGWAILLGEWTGIDAMSGIGNRIHGQLRALACEYGAQVEKSAWFARIKDTLYLPLYDREQRLVRIAPTGISLVKNGHDGAVVLPNPQVAAITFIPDAEWDAREGEAAWQKTWRLLNCSEQDQMLVSAWVASMPLFPWAETHPLFRFTGDPGSGKSTAAKIITSFLYGDVQLLKSTNAALFRMGSNSPLIALDNVEVDNVDESLEQFFLLAATGVERVKSLMDDPSQTVRERVSSWLLTTGIDPLGSGKRELMERTISVVFGGHEATGFLDDEVMRQTREARTFMWNHLFRILQNAVEAISTGAMGRIGLDLPKGSRTRLREFYISLSIVRGFTQEVDPTVLQILDDHTEAEEEDTVEDNPLVEMLCYLPSYLMSDSGKTLKGNIKVLDRGAMWQISDVQSQSLSSAMSSVARAIGKSYPYRSTQQLTTRIGVSKKILDRFGFKIDRGVRTVDGVKTRSWTFEIPKSIGKVVPEMFGGAP